MRRFEKISFEQFKKDITDNIELYNNYELPKRGTKASAGYDIASLTEYNLTPGDSVVIKTGIKVILPDDEMLMLANRSSYGYKYNVRLVNGVGIIDADYYGNELNEGHISVKLYNHGTEDLKINIGDRVAQGIFYKYLTTDNEEKIETKREGGIGSTGK